MSRGDDGSRSPIVYIVVMAILLWGVWNKGDLAVFLGLENQPSDYGEKSMVLADSMYWTLGPDLYREVHEATEDARVQIDMEDAAEAICEEEDKKLDLDTFECVDPGWW